AAEGRAPYLLAAGTRSPEAGPDPTFEAVWRTLAQQDETVPRAELGSMRVLGGAAAVTPVRAIPWTLVGLWVALAAGVLVVGAMAIRLGRELLTSADRR